MSNIYQDKWYQVFCIAENSCKRSGVKVVHVTQSQGEELGKREATKTYDVVKKCAGQHHYKHRRACNV